MILDGELLERYAKHQDQVAFAELVHRHLDGVFAAALRRVGGDTHLAEDVAQQVFLALARQSHRLARHPVLTGWLYVTTRNHAVMAVRAEHRRKVREAEAHLMNEQNSDPTPAHDWSRIGPAIDWAIEQLPEADRSAVLLRFIARKPFEEIGATLKISADAARMRVERATEKLRVVLARKGIVSTAALLSAELTRNAALAAPVTLNASVTAAALSTTPAVAGALATALQFMSTSKLISGVAAALVIAATLGTTVYSVQATREAEDALSEETAATARADETVSTLKTKLQRSEADAVALQKQIDDQASAIAAEETERKRTAPPDPKARGTEFMQRHPEVRQALVDWFNERSRAQFQSLFEKLKLSPAQIEECLKLMHENNWFGRPLNFAPNDYAILSVDSGLSQSDVTARLTAILGPDGMKQYWGIKAEQPLEHFTSQAASGLVFTENPLSTSQASQLRQIFLKYRQQTPMGMTLDWDKVAQDARQILSARQLEAIDALRDHNLLQKALLSRPTSNPATEASPASSKGKS